MVQVCWCVSLRHTYTTRCLFTLLPAEHYAPKHRSLHTLIAEMVRDANQLETEGLVVPGFCSAKALIY